MCTCIVATAVYQVSSFQNCRMATPSGDLSKEERVSANHELPHFKIPHYHQATCRTTCVDMGGELCQISQAQHFRHVYSDLWIQYAIMQAQYAVMQAQYAIMQAQYAVMQAQYAINQHAWHSMTSCMHTMSACMHNMPLCMHSIPYTNMHAEHAIMHACAIPTCMHNMHAQYAVYQHACTICHIPICHIPTCMHNMPYTNMHAQHAIYQPTMPGSCMMHVQYNTAIN